MRKIGLDQKKMIINMYLKDNSLSEISRKLDITYEDVYDNLKTFRNKIPDNNIRLEMINNLDKNIKSMNLSKFPDLVLNIIMSIYPININKNSNTTMVRLFKVYCILSVLNAELKKSNAKNSSASIDNVSKFIQHVNSSD